MSPQMQGGDFGTGVSDLTVLSERTKQVIMRILRTLNIEYYSLTFFF